MIFLNLFFVFSIFAHEDLQSMQCGAGKVIILRTNNGYDITTKDSMQTLQFKKPEMADFFNPDMKQLFDTYTFKKADFELVVFRPETKGKVTDTIASYKGDKLPCANYSKGANVGISGLKKLQPKDANQSQGPKK